MFKDLFDKGKCLLGFHDGPWNYRRAGDCRQVQTCRRCNANTERTEHTWGDWAFEADGRCDLARACTRCAQTEKQITHAWGEPEYADAGACDRVAVCTRCHGREAREPLHAFDRWGYRADDDCTQVRSCSRCRTAGTETRLHHDWDPWTASEFYEAQVRVCRHCGEMLIDSGTGSPGTHTVSMHAIEADINRLIAADTGPQVRAALAGPSGALLTPVVDKYFAFAFDQYPDDAFRAGPLTAARTVVTRCRTVGVDAALRELGIEAAPVVPAPAAPAPPTQTRAAATPRARPAAAGPLDNRLIGHWRSTEILGAGSGFSMTTDTHLVLDGSGQCELWMRTASGTGNAESGTWTAAGGRLTLAFDSDPMVRDYIIDGGSMLWPRDSRFRLWERIG